MPPESHLEKDTASRIYKPLKHGRETGKETAVPHSVSRAICQDCPPAAAAAEKGGKEMPIVTIRGNFYKERTFPSLNDYIKAIGTNPRLGGRFKQDYMKVTINAIRRCLKGYKVTRPPVVLHYTFYENSKGIRRDVMNIFSFADKVFEDALQECGVIENDNPKWVENTTHDFVWIDGEPFIEVEIEERG